MVADCRRPIKLDKGTAAFPKAKEYQKMKVAAIQLDSEEEGSSSEKSEEESSSSEESEEESSSSEESEGEYLDDEEEEQGLQEEEEKNWWDTPSSAED
jgi:hypothetical protein